MICHMGLSNLHGSLNEPEAVSVSENHIRKLMTEMELFCGVCGDTMGQYSEELYALPCGHLIHNRYFFLISKTCVIGVSIIRMIDNIDSNE